jgi:hypothetical protein
LCGGEINVHHWDNPPNLCKSCKAERAAQWYEKPCERCGTTMRVHRDWDNPPKYCKPCKAKIAAEWYEKPCPAGSRMSLANHLDTAARTGAWFRSDCDLHVLPKRGQQTH